MKQHTGKIYLTLAFSLAGTSVMTGHILSKCLSSFTITAVSLGILLLCLTPFYFQKTVATIRQLKREDWKLLVLQAAFGIFLFRAFLLYGVGLTSTVEAGILTGATPAITALLAFVFLKEQLSIKTVAGIACTVAGVVLLQNIDLSATGFSAKHLGGNMLILLAASSESTFNVLSRRHKLNAAQESGVQIHPMVQTLLVSAIAFVLSFIPAALDQSFTKLLFIGFREWLALAWYGLVVTALAFMCFYEGVKRCDAYTTAAFSGLIPLTSVLLSLLLLKETISLIQWIGGILVVFSMVLIGSREKASSLPANIVNKA